LNPLLACGMACTHVAISGIGTWSRCMSGGEKTSCSTAPGGKRSGTGASDVASCSMSRISLAADHCCYVTTASVWAQMILPAWIVWVDAFSYLFLCPECR
jgi:hypothetical protein